MSGPNKDQQRAIDATSHEDVIISAGAGSGKTFTLSIKIYEMVKRHDVLPSELLVLTFTNNAAHEMKERIVAEFKKNNSPYADEMISAHIQTFDAFSLYLVTKYAGKLSLSDKINNMDSSLLEAKKLEFLDEIFDEHYKNDKERMEKVLVKYNLQDDKNSKNVILDLYKNFDKMLEKERNDFIKNYQNNYLNRDFYDSLRHEYAESLREDISFALRYAEFLEYSGNSLEQDPSLIHQIGKILSFKDNFTQSCLNLQFDDEQIQQVYDELVPILESKNDDALFSFLPSLKEKYPDFFNNYKGTAAKKFLASYLRPNVILTFDKERDYQRFIDQSDDILLFIEMEEELRHKIEEYEKKSNTFSFSSISSLALKLLQDEQYKEVGDEIRNQFRFIMIDEYQDTNDLQEAFIAGLMKERKDGTRAHLFCVGDAKQSIYGFRNSNVALFNKRIEEYSVPSKEHYVIAMNRNYRSKKAVLDDINYIFDRYMTNEHGNITYLDPLQQLVCGTGGEKDMERKEGYGIIRLMYPTLKKETTSEKKKNECLAIIQDIKERMKNETMENRDGTKRPLCYSDFCILVRTKSGYSLYQQLFKENGIPLNNISKTNLKGIDAILLLQSLISLLDYKINHTRADVYHLFASVARSYIYQYDDDTIYKYVTYCEEKEGKMVRSLKRINDSEIMKTLDKFIFEHQKDSFDHIFLDLLNTFHIIDKLYLIGNVEDNIAKIESLHQMVVSGENMQEGLNEFVARFKTMDKYDLELNSDTLIKQEDAVDLMTIHASKGLEREIVYMPVSFNQKTSTPGMKKPDYDFSKEYGILLPDYGFGRDYSEERDDEGRYGPIDYPLYTLPYFLFKKKTNDPERDEHVRLVYVALTRAKRALVIVGNNSRSDASAKNKETLYGMMNYVPHVRRFSDPVLPFVEKYCNKEEKKKYQSMLNACLNFNPKFSVTDFKKESDFAFYDKVSNFIKGELDRQLEEQVDSMLLTVYEHLKEEYSSKEFTLDELTSMYLCDPSIHTFDDYLDNMKNEKDLDLESDDDDDDESEETVENEDADLDREELKDKILDFGKKLKEEDKSLYPYSQSSYTDTKLKIYLLSYYLFLKTSSSDTTFVSYYKKDEYPDLYQIKPLLDCTAVIKKEIVIDDPKKDERMKDKDKEIVFVKKEHKRASMKPVDTENEVTEALERGIRLHRLMELVSFTTRDTSFIKNVHDRKMIDSILSLPLFDGVNEDMVNKEFAYFDEEYSTSGSIDLLIRNKDNTFTIVDYKTSHIDKEEYDEQLMTYRRNVESIFGVNDNQVRMVLLSLRTGKTREVKD